MVTAWYAAVMRSQSAQVQIDTVTSFETLLVKLHQLETAIPQAGLRQFSVFNRAYLIVTSDLQSAAQRGYFKNPVFVERFTVRFARYYFQVVNDTMDENKVPVAWQILSQASKRSCTPNFILLLMGANAHINNDLPLTLLELIDEAEADVLFKDILRVDKLLMKSGRQIVSAFDEPNKLVDRLKRHFRFLYYRPIMYLVLYWRIKAWRNYQTLKRHGIEDSDYAKTSTKTAHRFFKLAQCFH